MKLKRILAGALAAVVSISTVALASLSTASAADPIDADWYGDGAGKLEGAQFKVIQNWNPGTTIDALSGATEFYVSFDVATDAEGLHAYLAFQDIGNKHSNWNYSADAAAKCPAVDCSKAGTYTVGYKGDAITDGFNFLAVIFVDAAGKEYGNDLVPGITLKGVYAEAPTATTEPETTEAPTSADPVEEAIDSIEYNFTVTAGGNNTVTFENQNVGWSSHKGSVAVTDSGDYSVKVTGMAATSGLTNLGYVAVDSGAVTLTVNSLVINDKYTFEVGKSLSTSTANANGMANIWNEEGKADVVYTGTGDGKKATLVGDNGTSIKLVVEPAVEPETTEAPTEPETTEATTEATTDQPQPAGALKAAICFADADWYPTSMEQADFVEITEDGTYTIKLKAMAADGTLTPIEGAMVFCIDFVDAVVNYPNMTAELVEVACDGGKLEIDPTKAIFGNIETDNDHLRLEIRNEYGNTKADPAVDPSEIYADEELTVTFKVTLDAAPATTEAPTEETTEATTEPCDVTVSLTPDKAYALPGDEVTYTVAVTPNQPLYTLQMFMNMPEGLAYVPESFVMDENAKANLGFDSLDWTEQTLCLNGVGATPKDTTNQTVTLGTFKVLATELGAYTPAFDRYEFCNDVYETISYAVAAAPVEYVTEIPTEAPTTEAPTEAPTAAPTDAPATDPTAAPAPTDAPVFNDPTVAPTTAATTASTTAATTAATTSNNNNNNDTPNTGAQAAVGLSIFMAAGLAGVVAIKKRRK